MVTKIMIPRNIRILLPTGSHNVFCKRFNTLIATLTVIILIPLLIYIKTRYVLKIRKNMIDEFNKNNTGSPEDYGIEYILLKLDSNKVKQDQHIELNNELAFTSHQGYDLTAVLVILCDDKIHHLVKLIESLTKVIGIRKSLIIFSQKQYNRQYDIIVNEIKFVKNLQIHFPFSMTLNQEDQDSFYCNENQNCNTESGERKASKNRMKHYWWWTVNFVFNRIGAVNKFSESIIFLEEDQYVTDDLIYMLKFMDRSRKYIKNCGILSLGAYSPSTTNYHVMEAPASIVNFASINAFIGLAFNRTVFNFFQRNKLYYCNYKSNKWETSLQNLITKVSGTYDMMLALRGPRVFQTSYENDIINNYDENIDILNNNVKRIQEFISLIKRGLFPMHLVYEKTTAEYPNIENEDLIDILDNDLCMSI